MDPTQLVCICVEVAGLRATAIAGKEPCHCHLMQTRGGTGAEQGRNQAPLAKKKSRNSSGCEVVTYVRNIRRRHRYIFHRDAPTETMPPYIYWYII